MNNVEDTLLKIKQEIEKEKKAALASLGRIKLEKEFKSEGIAKELNSLNNRDKKLRQIISDLNLQFSSILNETKFLREQKRDNKLKLVSLKKDVKALTGVEKEISPLQKKFKELIDVKSRKAKILNSKKKENNIKSAELDKKKKGLEELASALGPMQGKIKELIGIKKQKEELRKTLTEQVSNLQLRLNTLVKSIDALKKKQIDPLHLEISVLLKKKNEKQNIYLKLKSIVPILYKSIQKQADDLAKLESKHRKLLDKITITNNKIKEKEHKQRRLLKLKQEIPLIEKKIPLLVFKYS